MPAPKLFFRISISCLIFCYLCACESVQTSSVSYTTTDLEPYGIPISIPLPEKAHISESNYTYEKGLIVYKDSFDMRIDYFQREPDDSLDAENLKKNELSVVQSEPDVKKIVLDTLNGFVYETEDEELGSSYHFFYVLVKDRARIEMREGIPKKENFSLGAVMSMFSCAQNAK